MTPTRRYFDKHARSFDRLYESQGVTARLRRGPPGRVAEAVLEAGAARYVGLDLSAEMLALARRRVDDHAEVELVEGDFLDLDPPGMFDVVLALGLFDYLPEARPGAAWMRARCTSTLVASFSRWDRVKAPLRRLYYALYGCPLFNYTEAGAEELLRDAGFSGVKFVSRGPRGFLVVARA